MINAQKGAQITLPYLAEDTLIEQTVAERMK